MARRFTLSTKRLPKSANGAATALRRINLQELLPADIALDCRVNFTPNFILLVASAEVVRLKDTPQEDFNWGLLGQMLTREGINFASEGNKAPKMREFESLAQYKVWPITQLMAHIARTSKEPKRRHARRHATMTLPGFDDTTDDAHLDAMLGSATIATNYLKAISHEGRLVILCHLATGEKSVIELESLLSARQAAISQ